MCGGEEREGTSKADSVSDNGFCDDATEKKGQPLVNLGVKLGLGCAELTEGGWVSREPDLLQIALHADTCTQEAQK